jgi:hypothetical protein
LYNGVHLAMIVKTTDRLWSRVPPTKDA